jgi:hypothetical protein
LERSRVIIDEILDQWGDLRAAHGKALILRRSIDRLFEHEPGVNLLHGPEGDRRDDGRRFAARLRGDVRKLP